MFFGLYLKCSLWVLIMLLCFKLLILMCYKWLISGCYIVFCLSLVVDLVFCLYFSKVEKSECCAMAVVNEGSRMVQEFLI